MLILPFADSPPPGGYYVHISGKCRRYSCLLRGCVATAACARRLASKYQALSLRQRLPRRWRVDAAVSGRRDACIRTVGLTPRGRFSGPKHPSDVGQFRPYFESRHLSTTKYVNSNAIELLNVSPVTHPIINDTA